MKRKIIVMVFFSGLKMFGANDGRLVLARERAAVPEGHVAKLLDVHDAHIVQAGGRQPGNFEEKDVLGDRSSVAGFPAQPFSFDKPDDVWAADPENPQPNIPNNGNEREGGQIGSLLSVSEHWSDTPLMAAARKCDFDKVAKLLGESTLGATLKRNSTMRDKLIGAVKWLYQDPHNIAAAQAIADDIYANRSLLSEEQSSKAEDVYWMFRSYKNRW